jgi:hypothetical protein
MQKFSDTVSTVNGSAIEVLSSANVTVRVAGTQTLATIYSSNGGSPQQNPFLSSSTGLIEFYAADGRYDIVVSKAGYATVTVSDVLLEDPADAVDDDVVGVTGVVAANSTINDNKPTFSGTGTVGDLVKVQFNARAKESKGKWFASLNLWKIEVI